MQTRTQRLDEFISGLPRLSLPKALSVFGLSWGALMLYDIVLGSWERSAYDFDLLRMLIPLVGFAPMYVRMLRPDDIRDDGDAYETFVRMTTISLVLVVVSALMRVVPFSYTPLGIPESFWSFMVGRAISLLPLLMLPTIAELIVRLIRYRSRRSVPLLARLVTYGIGLLFVVAQLFPTDLRPVGDDPTPGIAIGSILGFLALILTARARWIVNLRRRQKWALLGLSFLGMMAAVYFAALDDTSEFVGAMAATFPALPAMASACGMLLINIQLALFVHAMIALPTANAMDRRSTEVTSLATFGKLLTRSFDITDLIETSIGVACDVTGSRAAWIELQRAGDAELLLGHSPRLTSMDAIRLMTSTVADGTTLAESVRAHRDVQVIDRAHPTVGANEADRTVQRRETAKEKAARVASAPNRTLDKSRSEQKELSTVAAAPLVVGDLMLGTLYVAKERAQEFDRDDLAILGTVADQIAMAMQHSELIHSSIASERIEQEMLIARDLQQRLLPRSMPVSKWYDLHAESEPAQLVGGDYYDIVSFSDGTLGVVIADVSGKGPSAALYMGMIKGVIQALAGSTATPRDLLAKINVALHGQIDPKWFATMTCAQILEERRILRVARAGHCPTLIIRNGVGEYRRSRGLGLAIARPLMFERNLELEELNFSADDYVVLLSDGIPEARSPEGEEFGYERLMAIATEASALNPSPVELRNTIFTELSAFTRGELPIDDSTIVLLRWKQCSDYETSS